MAQALVPLKYKQGKLEVLNQLLLPQQEEWEEIESLEDGWQAIRQMKVRGAPAIAVVAALTLAGELRKRQHSFTSVSDVTRFLDSSWEYLCTSRPTAVNLFRMADELQRLARSLAESAPNNPEGMISSLLKVIEEEKLAKDIADNRAIGSNGADAILSSVPEKSQVLVITHCNTGSLATTGYGTALGVVRALHERGRLGCCYCTETRPYLQGARLTAYELATDKIPGTLIPDSAVASLMSSQTVSAVVVGADRVAANGDTANKIGTYQLAVAAQYHQVRFYVAAPGTSIDLSLASGKEIKIEERPAEELKSIRGVQIAPEAIECWNPAFDVTPAALITGIITEHGAVAPSNLKSFFAELT